MFRLIPFVRRNAVDLRLTSRPVRLRVSRSISAPPAVVRECMAGCRDPSYAFHVTNAQCVLACIAQREREAGAVASFRRVPDDDEMPWIPRRPAWPVRCEDVCPAPGQAGHAICMGRCASGALGDQGPYPVPRSFAAEAAQSKSCKDSCWGKYGFRSHALYRACVSRC